MAVIPGKQVSMVGRMEDLQERLSDRELGFCLDDHALYIKLRGMLSPVLAGGGTFMEFVELYGDPEQEYESGFLEDVYDKFVNGQAIIFVNLGDGKYSNVLEMRMYEDSDIPVFEYSFIANVDGRLCRRFFRYSYVTSGTSGPSTCTYHSSMPVDFIDAGNITGLSDGGVGSVQDGSEYYVKNCATQYIATGSSEITIVVTVNAEEYEGVNFAVVLEPSVNCRVSVCAEGPGINGRQVLHKASYVDNVIYAGWTYQLTAVGDCWAMLEYE